MTTPEQRIVDAAKRLMKRDSQPWLAVPKFVPDVSEPVCVGCGVEAAGMNGGYLIFMHALDCAAFDLAEAVMDLDD